MFPIFEDYKNYSLNEIKNTLLNIIFSLLVLKNLAIYWITFIFPSLINAFK